MTNTARFDWRIGNHLMGASMTAPAVTRVHEGRYACKPKLAAVDALLAAQTPKAAYTKLGGADTFLGDTVSTLLKLTTSGPAVGDVLSESGEYVKVLDVSAAPVYTVARGFYGTTKAVHAAGATWTYVGTVVVPTAQPDVPRQLTITGSASGMNTPVLFEGEDFSQNVIRETVTASGTTTPVSANAFASVSFAIVGPRHAAGDTLTVGTGAKVGVPYIIGEAAALTAADFNGAADAGTLTANATLSLNVYAAAGTFDGTKELALFVKVWKV